MKHLAASLLALCLAAACSSPEPFQGTELTSGSLATPFELQNQFGRPVSLSNFDSKVVVLTFLYTNCPDVCPLMTSHLREAHAMLGEEARDVALVAISVDPDRDTVESAYTYSERWQMAHNWDFLVGTREQLAPIWEAYYIDPVAAERTEGNEAHTNEDNDHQDGGANSYLVSHSAPVYLIDPDRIMRAVFTLPFAPEALVHDVRLLLK